MHKWSFSGWLVLEALSDFCVASAECVSAHTNPLALLEPEQALCVGSCELMCTFSFTQVVLLSSEVSESCSLVERKR